MSASLFRIVRPAQGYVCRRATVSLVPTARHKTDYASKYSAKLSQRAEQEGLTVDALRARVKDAERAAAQERLARAKEAEAQSTAMDGVRAKEEQKAAVRKDSSPIKPLSSILNIDRILGSPHTPEQVSALWTAYHASRSRGTGRGVICASVPRAAYETMLAVAARYPQFILPIPRATEPGEGEERGKAYEFFMLQWDQYDPPAEPEADSDPFAGKARREIGLGSIDSPEPLPRSATAIFTPLGEYKLKQTFAAPHLALTFYPDLANTHGFVLLRGELTPRTTDPNEFLLSQQDAQMLAMGLQRFYLWGTDTSGEQRESLLKTFHEKPEEFKWEDLIKLGGDVLA